MLKITSLTLVLTLTAAAGAAEIVLRPVANPSGNIVTLADLADVRTTDANRAHRLSSLPLIPAPAPGTSQFVRRQQIEEMLVAHGEDLASHRISGASQIRIGESPRRRGTAVRTFPKRLTLGTTRQLHDAVEIAILENLQVYAAANEPWEVRFDLTTAQLRRLATANTPITAAGGSPPWTGTQRFTLRFTTPDGPVTTPVVAEVVLPDQVVVATRAITSGMIIRASDVVLKRLPPEKRQSRRTETFTRLEDVVGMEAVRPIRAGRSVGKSTVRQPIVVRRGETVSVVARTGGVQVRTTARAQEDGARGDLIIVETLPGKERFAVNVTGPREVSVFAQSVDASAYGNGRRDAAVIRRELTGSRTRRRPKVLVQRDAELEARGLLRKSDPNPMRPDYGRTIAGAVPSRTEPLKWHPHRRAK